MQFRKLEESFHFLDQLRTSNRLRQVEWQAGHPMSLSYRGNELAGEVGEACNLIKKLDREKMGVRGSKASVMDLAEELADVIICVDLIAGDLNIDLSKAIRDKFNKTGDKYGLRTHFNRMDVGE